MKKITAAALLLCAAFLSGCDALTRVPELTPAPAVYVTAAPPAGDKVSVGAATPLPEQTAEAPDAVTPPPAAEATPEPQTDAATPEPGTTAAPVEPGTYTYQSGKGQWTLQLREEGIFTLTDPDGGIHTGEGWTTEADGTVSCGPTDIAGTDFAYADGTSRWIVTGSACRPVTP